MSLFASKDGLVKIEDFCYESYPCQHHVCLRGNRTMMGAREICDLIVNNQLEISYEGFQHFEYIFKDNPKYGAYLRYLKNKMINMWNDGIITDRFISDSYKLFDALNGRNPQITYSEKVFRRSTPNIFSTIKLKKVSYPESEKRCDFIFNYDSLDSIIGNKSVIVKNFYCTSNPDELEVNWAGCKWNYYGKCMKPQFEFLEIPLATAHDFKLTASGENMPDEIYASLSIDNGPPRGRSLPVNRLVYSQNLIGLAEYPNENHIFDADGYYSTLFVWCEKMDDISSITLKINNIPLLFEVNPKHVKTTNNMIEISISGEMHGAVLSDKSIQLSYESKDNQLIKLELYGNKQHIIKVLYNRLEYLMSEENTANEEEEEN